MSCRESCWLSARQAGFFFSVGCQDQRRTNSLVSQCLFSGADAALWLRCLLGASIPTTLSPCASGSALWLLVPIVSMFVQNMQQCFHLRGGCLETSAEYFQTEVLCIYKGYHLFLLRNHHPCLWILKLFRFVFLECWLWGLGYVKQNNIWTYRARKNMNICLVMGVAASWGSLVLSSKFHSSKSFMMMSIS